MLTAKHGSELKMRWQSAPLERHSRMSGGSSDADEKELAVKPHGFPSSSLAVAMTTPLGKRLMASLNIAASRALEAEPPSRPALGRWSSRAPIDSPSSMKLSS